MSIVTEDFYRILGVDKSASGDDIRSAYRRLARKYHPDVNPGDEKAEAQFKNISGAYDVLSNKDKRAAYDEFGEESLKGGFDPDKARAYKSWQSGRARGAESFGGGAADFDLGDLFGFGGRGGPRRPARGADVRAYVDMDLRQALSGGDVRVDLQGRKPVTVRVPKGADNGSTIRLKGKGSPGPHGGPAGDLVLEMRVAPHPFVSRDGLNLQMTVPVTLDEAYNGGAIDLPTFSGTVTVQVPPCSQSGQKLRLRGKGAERGDKRGDLFVKLDVRMPDKLSDELASALKESSAAYSAPVRKEMKL